MSIAITKNSDKKNGILAEIDLSSLAALYYHSYEPILESKGFKIISSSGALNNPNLKKYDLKYKKSNGIINIGIITFASDESEGILRSSFSDYEFILTLINSPEKESIPLNQNNNEPQKPLPKKQIKKQDKPSIADENPVVDNSIPLDELPEIQQKILDEAKKYIGSDNWSKSVSKTSNNGKTTFDEGEYKCNLFVYDVLDDSGIDIGLPSYKYRFKKFYNGDFSRRPYTCKQWYKEKVPCMKCIGKGVEGLKKSLPGDIITNGRHMGIISGPNKTISASSVTNTVVENDWGWREEQKNEVNIFRYNPEK
jgi:hypothetical protein